MGVGVIFDKNHWRSFTLWLQNPENQQDIEEWSSHMRTLYPQIDQDPDWLLKKYNSPFYRANEKP